MQGSVAKYELNETLYQSSRTTIHRGVRTTDDVRVVIKLLGGDYPRPRDSAQLRREFRVARQLRAPGIIDVYALEPWGNGLALVQEDFGGMSLAGQAQQDAGVPLDTFFAIAVPITRVLAHVHLQVVHGDVSPANVLWNPATHDLRLIDFGASSEIRREARRMFPEDLPETSLPYVAPETSGRMNRDFDQRADLYSLGAMFYELLTGRQPFAAKDRGEWIYAHLSRQPRAPHEIAPGCPEALSRIVLRLMAKNPEDRYQSARGLLSDLEECQKRWAAKGAIDLFPLGRRDAESQLQLPQRLFGREGEVQTLQRAFHEVAGGATRVVVVSGEAGIGKSALVNECRRTISQLNGYFAEGKFDQSERHAPYQALAEAFRQLVVQLLSEPEESLARWADELREALAPNGQLIVDLVPAIERVIGPQPPVAPGNPVEEQNRFQATVTSLVRTFARSDHPLVLFLDDLQWSNAPTLSLLKRLLADRPGGSLLLIGAYRDDEVDERHPLTALLSEIGRTQSVEHIRLTPLEPAVVSGLLREALSTSSHPQTIELAKVLCDKAHGNPLVLGELLCRLNRDGGIFFDADRGAWTWDLDRIRRVTGGDAVDLMLRRLLDLSAETQTWLRLAACLGASFDLDTLAIVAEGTPSAAAEGLSQAVRDGLLLRVSDDYRVARGKDEGVLTDTVPFDGQYQFQHDRVQQAAYALIPEPERKREHLRIGRLLLERTPSAKREERLIAIVQHLNEGAALLETDAQRLELSSLNLAAARKANASVAYAPAFKLLKVARSVLPANAWEAAFTLAYDVYSMSAACAYLVGELGEAAALCQDLLRKARTRLEKAQVFAMQLTQLTYCDRMEEAIEAGLRGLRLLGIRVGAHPATATIVKELLLAKAALGGRPVAKLEDAPEITNPEVRLCMRILIDFIPPAYLTGNDRLFAAVVLKQVRLSLRHGGGAESAAAYASYVVLLAGLGDLKSANEFGLLAVRLTERYKATESRCRNLVLSALFGQSWSRPWRELRPCFQEAVRAGLESGDLLFAAYACGWIHLWDPDLDVRTAWDEGRKYLGTIAKTDYQNARDAAELSQQFWTNLLGHTKDRLSLSDDQFDEEACQARMARVSNVSGGGIHALYRIQICLFYEEPERGFDVIREARALVRALAGSPYMVEYCLHAFLVCASIPDGGADVRAARRHVRRLHGMMKKWARHNPENFGQYLVLMDAEWARLTGDVAGATRLYDAAVTAARKGAFARYEALANERAAHFFVGQGSERIAAVYMREARYHYARWGATAKVEFLDERYARLLGGVPESHEGDVSPRNGVGGSTLDLATVLNASQAISEEVILERLLERLAAIVRENAGATRVSLLLREQEGLPLLVQAETREGGPTEVMQRHPLEGADLPLSIIRYVDRSGEPLVLADAAREREFIDDPYFREHAARSMLALPIVHRGEALGVLYLENDLASGAFTDERLTTLRMLSSQAAISIQNARLYEHVQKMVDSFSRFVPREFLRSLGRSQFLDIKLGESVQKVMTVLFSDIRGFTTIVERMSPTENIDFLNAYIAHMEPPILAHGGFVDSYVGDAIMALFDRSPSDAVDAAASMLRAVDAFNLQRAVSHDRPIAIGIGLNTGMLTLGTIGGAERLKCGVIGDTVNVASRIEGLTKRYRVPLLVSGETRERLVPRIRAHTRFLDRVRVAGHAEPIDMYEVFDADAPLVRSAKAESGARWQGALDLYYARQFSEATRAFGALREKLFDDHPSALFEERSRRFAIDPPAEGWSGVEVLSEK
jgi:predicted ATPase/class 3 adenylate cyclase/GAF domain-containing protein